MHLPAQFLDRMKSILGAEYPAFKDSYEKPRRYGLRINPLKIDPDTFEEISSFHLEKIPWIRGGYYYDEADACSRHPFYHAGLYYLQEPTAMTPAAVLGARPGEKILDLCAAPGGKATALGAMLQGEGLLVANDISAARCRALLKNIEVFGIANAFVTNSVPARLAEAFPGMFDRVALDAPCSGEGMFRKDEGAVNAWYPEKNDECAKIQKGLILNAADMLKPGGVMLYSTCTFSPKENEEVIAWLLDNRPEMRLKPIPMQEGFAAGLMGLDACVRLWPHRIGGEGHFLALLEKEGQGSEPICAADPAGISEMKNRDQKRGQTRTSRVRADKRAKREPGEQDIRTAADFLREQGFDPDMKRLRLQKNAVYYDTGLVPDGRLTFLRNGLYLGDIKKGRFEPSGASAMAMPGTVHPRGISLRRDDQRLARYFRGETLELSSEETGMEGWVLVCVEGYPLGWGKCSGRLLKNKYHPGWRVKT